MVTKIVWECELDQAPKHRYTFAAFPGVGNVGKLLVDGLVDGLESTPIAKMYHPDMPPQANLIDGLLTPPHLSVNSVNLGEENVLVISGEGQPLTPSGQYEMAESILTMVSEFGCKYALVLAGLSSEPNCEDVFAICADSEMIDLFESGGGEIATEKPSGGVIGLAGLIASMGPIHEVSSGCVVAATIGSSVDIHAAERLRLALQNWLGIKMPIPIATTEEIADRIERLIGDYPETQFSLDLEDDKASTLYA